MTKDSHAALLAALKNPFDPKYIKWRVGATNRDKTKGIALAYVDAREVKKRFDEVMGIENWDDDLERFDGGFVSRIKLRVGDEWLQRAGAGEDSNMSPVKGGASDAFKRAAAKWGVGHYLYYLPNVWVPIIQNGKSYALAEVPELPSWAEPNPDLEDWEAIAELEKAASGADDDETIDPELFKAYETVVGFKTTDELEKYMKTLNTDYQISLTAIVNKKTEELLANESKSSKNKA